MEGQCRGEAKLMDQSVHDIGIVFYIHNVISVQYWRLRREAYQGV